jgi:hypothetical protein
MRSHGVPAFPDPDHDGVFTLPATVDEQAPAFVHATRPARTQSRAHSRSIRALKPDADISVAASMLLLDQLDPADLRAKLFAPEFEMPTLRAKVAPAATSFVAQRSHTAHPGTKFGPDDG